MKFLKVLSVFFFALFSLSSFAATASFRMAAVEVDGVKFWLPSTLVVHKGDSVEIQAVSKVPGDNSVHGLMIKDFNVVEVVDTKGKTVKFTADKAGTFPITCQLHPAHIGGQ